MKLDLTELQKIWRKPEQDLSRTIELWDTMAVQRSQQPLTLPSWQTSPFLMQLAQEAPLGPDWTVLDIGCGTGGYSFAISQRVKHVVGIDVSPKMIALAKQRAQQLQIENVTFLCGDFTSLDFAHPFDLSFAHMSPAVSDAITLNKMLACSKGYCYLVKAVRRIDSILDPLKTMCSIPLCPPFDEGLLYTFAILHQLGKLPQVTYRPNHWTDSRPVDLAGVWYLNRLRAYRELPAQLERQVLDYLEKVSVNGIVEEDTKTIIATIMWRI